MKLVSERSIKEFAAGQRRDLKLTTPVTIKADKTYWTAVKCVGTQGVVSVACDKTRELRRRSATCSCATDASWSRLTPQATSMSEPH